MEKDCKSQRCHDILSNPYKLRHPFLSLLVPVPVSICGVFVRVCVFAHVSFCLSACLSMFACVCACVCMCVYV